MRVTRRRSLPRVLRSARRENRSGYFSDSAAVDVFAYNDSYSDFGVHDGRQITVTCARAMSRARPYGLTWPPARRARPATIVIRDRRFMIDTTIYGVWFSRRAVSVVLRVCTCRAVETDRMTVQATAARERIDSRCCGVGSGRGGRREHRFRDASVSSDFCVLKIEQYGNLSVRYTLHRYAHELLLSYTVYRH